MDQITSEPKVPKNLSKRELKALKKAAKLAAKQQKKKQEIWMKFNLETQLGEKSLLRIKYKWDEILGQLTEKELCKEMTTWAKSAEKQLEQKDEKIRCLTVILDEICEMQMRKKAMHVEQLEYISKCHQVLRQSILNIFDFHTSKVLQDFLEMANEKRSNQHKYNTFCENIAYTKNEFRKKLLTENYEKYMKDHFDTACSEIETRYILKDSTVEKMKCLQAQLLLFMKALEGDNLYVNKNERFFGHMKKEGQLRKESIKLNEYENICRSTLMGLKRELLDVETRTNSKVQGLRLEYNYFMAIKTTLLGFVNRNKLFTHKKLHCESNASYKTIKELEKIVKNGELMLSMAANCRKYETGREKVMPFEDVDRMLSNTELNMTTINIKQMFNISEEDLIYQMQHLDKFFKRISKVNFHTIVLRQNKRNLLATNEKYLEIIRSMHKSEDMKHIMESLAVNPIKLHYV